jgi:hypothetical protein
LERITRGYGGTTLWVNLLLFRENPFSQLSGEFGIYLDDGSSKYIRNAVTHFPYYIPQANILREEQMKAKVGFYLTLSLLMSYTVYMELLVKPEI